MYTGARTSDGYFLTIKPWPYIGLVYDLNYDQKLYQAWKYPNGLILNMANSWSYLHGKYLIHNKSHLKIKVYHDVSRDIKPPSCLSFNLWILICVLRSIRSNLSTGILTLVLYNPYPHLFHLFIINKKNHEHLYIGLFPIKHTFPNEKLYFLIESWIWNIIIIR